jgi:hypothetical protein
MCLPFPHRTIDLHAGTLDRTQRAPTWGNVQQQSTLTRSFKRTPALPATAATERHTPNQPACRLTVHRRDPSGALPVSIGTRFPAPNRQQQRMLLLIGVTPSSCRPNRPTGYETPPPSRGYERRSGCRAVSGP